jgi:protein gp37
MGFKTNISWTHHTWNSWWGCVKVSPGCKFCYAERDSNRFGFNLWGPNSERRFFGDKHWNEPLKWNRLAESEGNRRRVFCASMADVFEDHPQLPEQRRRLFDLICKTPWLDWQVLTKRPENALQMMVEAGLYTCANPNLPHPQPNLWIGCSPCDQETADESITHLLKVPAAIRFLSCEPLIGPMDLSGVLSGIDWVIIGGESGSSARPCEISWIADIIAHCRRENVPVFVKQDFGRYPGSQGRIPDELWLKEFPLSVVMK